MQKLVKVKINHFLLVTVISPFPSYHLQVDVHIFLVTFTNDHSVRIVALIHKDFFVFELQVKFKCNLRGVDPFTMGTLDKKEIYL